MFESGVALRFPPKSKTLRVLRHRWLRQQLLHQFTVHICQAEVAALETIREFRVIETEQVENRRVQVVDVDFVLRHVEAEVV